MNLLLFAASNQTIFKTSDSISSSYIGYVFLVLIGLIGLYIAILLLLKKLNIIKSYGSQKANLQIIHRSKLHPNLDLLHYEYLGTEYLILDNGKELLDLSHTLKKEQQEIE